MNHVHAEAGKNIKNAADKQPDIIIPGFLAGAVSAGIKYKDKLDLGLVYAPDGADVAGLFTRNKVKAAPVLLSMQQITSGSARAVLVNSGNANACTGIHGIEAARVCMASASEELNISVKDILIASTGVIGAPLPTEKITGAMPKLVKNLSPEGFSDLSKAIMTTDTFPKTSFLKGKISGKPFSILGIAKGAGMIQPDLATMICLVLTDISIDSNLLHNILKTSVARTLNSVTIDGDTSTNDCIIALASGKAKNPAMNNSARRNFKSAMEKVLLDLAKQIAKDGEGASRMFTVEVKGAINNKDAKHAAFAIANSPLVKTAVNGSDPNWGRIMAALGRSGISFKPENVDINIEDIPLVKNGMGMGKDYEAQVSIKMKKPEFNITIDLKTGKKCFWRVFTCDFSKEYISINADYRS